ncbi:flagellar basal body L-ring protein FlgH [Microbulbifer harenosus]|uniref:Flagellar L-ring protein n=1 Tax=Microbulbifer harenosus TaxID=2576840 RepID=A0ABY2UMX3_9GAMM|nr:flagellar basal body L-ring protein FlgH [Microbulbifer harenosus]TLM79965.1 flagellar basal body L-ring protein FlgH [Microbulbifer harenosus]
MRAPIVAILAVVLFAGGCAQLPQPSLAGEPEWVEIPQPPAPRANGAIFQPDVGYRPLFEDYRPRMSGDLLTVVFNEQVSASKSSQANADREGSTAFVADTVPIGLEKLADYGIEVSGSNSFEGSGGAQARNTFTGTLTVTVLEVLPNRNLRVRGEKQIRINQGTEFIRFSGIVDPREIAGDNSVLSTQVADARIEYVGDGYINEAQTMGWLQRLLLNLSPY